MRTNASESAASSWSLPSPVNTDVYDSEIHLTIRTGGKRIVVALGTDFTGLEGKAFVGSAAAILPQLQSLIHEHAPGSKYDVERLGGTFTPEMARIPE